MLRARSPNRRRPTASFLAGAALSVAVAALVLAASSPAGAASFVAGLDRDAVAPGDPFIYEVTLTAADERIDGYRPPDFRALRMVSATGPNRSTQVQMGGGQTSVQNGYTWRYQLMLPPGAKSGVTIGPAHVRVAGRDVASNPVQVRIGAGAARPPAAARVPGGGLFPRGLFDDGPPEEPAASSSGVAFIRAVADKPRAFVGEQVTVAWYLYLTEPQNNFQPLAQPRTDGFWVEDVPSTNPQGRLAFTDQVEGGRSYQVALLAKKALFPLAPGKLTVTAMEAEVSRVDFFGRPVRSRRLKSDPLAIEAVALPRDGQPPGFQAGNVGKVALEATVDRPTLAVGDAVTIKLTARGTGNVRNFHLPALAPLDGWKSYEPKTDATVDGGEVISGTKTIEWLLRPERGGKTVVPPFEMTVFDPGARRYVQERTPPLEIVVTGEAGAPPPGATGSVAAAPSGAGTADVAAVVIRPIRVRATPGREVGRALLRGSPLAVTLVAPPLGFAAFLAVGRMRRRLEADGPSARRRRARALTQKRLRAAETHRAAGQAAPFYLEIDRVLREALAERLRVPVAGLRLDELGALLRRRGMPDPDGARVIAALEAGDEARFAPSASAATPDALAAALTRAADLIELIERTPLTEGASS